MNQRIAHSPRPQTRGGFTLVEMTVVLSLLAVILPLAAGTLVFLLRAQSQSADALRDAMALTQLSHTFRGDVHAAQSAKVSSGSSADGELTLELADGRTIEYHALPQEGAISRVVERGKTVERRERFRIGTAQPKFTLADQGREVALTIAPRLSSTGGAHGAAPTALIRLGAMVGRDARVGGLPVIEKTPPALPPAARKSP